MIGGDHVAPFVERNKTLEFAKRLGIDPAASILVEPAKLGSGEKKDTAQNHCGDAFGVFLGVGQSQRRPPRAAEELPATNAKLASDTLDIVDKIRCRVVFERSIRRRASAAALIEENDAKAIGIVETAHRRVAAAAGTAMNDQHRLTIGIAALLDVEIMMIADVQPMLAIGRERRVEVKPIANGHVLLPLSVRTLT